MSKVKLSKHAMRRIQERCRLSIGEVQDIVSDPDRTVPLGIEGGAIHRVFYSSVDDDCFIVVQDEDTGDVITIKSMTMGHRVPITNHVVRWAKQIANKSSSSSRCDEDEFSVFCVVSDSRDSELPKEHEFGTWCGDWNGSAYDFFNDMSVRAEIEDKIEKLREYSMNKHQEVAYIVVLSEDADPAKFHCPF